MMPWRNWRRKTLKPPSWSSCGSSPVSAARKRPRRWGCRCERRRGYGLTRGRGCIGSCSDDRDRTMSRERDIFFDVLEVDSPGARALLLESLCAGDADLLARVQMLLNAHEAGPGFLDAAAVPTPGAPISTEQPGSEVGRYR